MLNDDNKKTSHSTFRQITERFCSHLGDNVVVMQTVQGEHENYECLSAALCPNRSECKNNR